MTQEGNGYIQFVKSQGSLTISLLHIHHFYWFGPSGPFPTYLCLCVCVCVCVCVRERERYV